MDKMKSSSTFFLSGFIAFSLYFITIIFVSFYITSSDTKVYSFKDTSIQIDLQMFETKSSKIETSKIVKQEIKKEPEITKQQEASVSNKKFDAKSLFANFSETAKKTEDEKINNIKKSIDPKRFKGPEFIKEKREPISLDRVFENNKTSTSLNSSSSGDNQEDDEYMKEINNLLSKWIPISESKELKAVVIISIDSNGTFDYSFLRFSNNEIFDNSLKIFLDTQKTINYPIPKKGNIRIEVEFKQKDKNG
ncbi:TonB C-terminal domain-containing protein [Aliarcobacter skirrowii]|uniref:TonB C-terminal domain-containing protein n=1 Tax=Aliarcobacter skirrowii TaxID=28200 RepID=UPI0029B51F0B|nr:TonB C-terminal domain-containing protein [Aliarcobacter skirrowii]MDX4011438.1 TonB C-terminal domain-containing protein [Aliarcobacter skirrowii]